MSAKQVEAPPGGQLSRKHLSAALQAMLAAALFCALWIALGSQVIGAARRHDFLNLYTGASLALDGNYAGLHDPAVQFARERRIVPDLDALVPFVRPPFYAALLAPLALMPFGVAFAVWILFQGLLLIGCWAWAFRRWGPDALILGAMYLPTALGIAHGQDCVFMLVVMIAAYATAERGQVFASGAWLGLGLIKFHLFLLWPFSLAVQRRWRMLAGFTGMAFLETLISFVLGGRTGLARYAALLQNNQVPHLNPSPELMINVYGLARNLGGRRHW